MLLDGEETTFLCQTTNAPYAPTPQRQLLLVCLVALVHLLLPERK